MGSNTYSKGEETKEMAQALTHDIAKPESNILMSGHLGTTSLLVDHGLPSTSTYFSMS